MLIGQLQSLVNQQSRGRLDTPVLATVATRRQGIAELVDALEAHRRAIEASGELERKRADRARRQLISLVLEQLLAGLQRDVDHAGRLEALVAAVARREIDPYAAAQRLIAREG
jgi:LAO/AO transport system kinase